MKRLIKQIQAEWQVAKEAAAMQCEHQGDVRMAKLLRECRMFRGDETLEELIGLMFTPRGIEFLTRFHFPTLSTFRKFLRYKPERFGVFIDAGKIALTDTERAFLVGNTTAYIKYGKTALNRLYMMHGATANITAKGFSVVKVERDNTASIQINIEDNAKVLYILIEKCAIDSN